MVKVAVIDLETTGFDPGDCIVEVGVCELDLDTGQTVKLLDMPVREPHFQLSLHRQSWIFYHSTLKLQDVLDGTSWENARKELAWVLDEYPVTAFNKAFDFSFLKHRDLMPKRELPCPMLKAAEVLRIPGPYTQQMVDKPEYKWPTLQEAWEHYYPGLDYVEQHRAFDDALHEALLVKAMHTAGDYELEVSGHG